MQHNDSLCAKISIKKRRYQIEYAQHISGNDFPTSAFVSVVTVFLLIAKRNTYWLNVGTF
jgi:hypothetical protein